MHKVLIQRLAILGLVILTASVEATTPESSTGTQNTVNSKTEEKFDIMRRNEIDSTDALAIPFDDSEVEDEEEINRAEKKQVFPLPHSR
jgi:uncharacterized protein YabE (DUF348 family)